MSLFVFGPRHHAPACEQQGGHPPVLCGCRPLDVTPHPGGDLGAARTRLGRALSSFFYSLDDKDVA